MDQLDQLARNYGLSIALLIVAVGGLLLVIRSLYAENKALYGRIETLLSERVKTLDMLLQEALSGRRDRT